MNDPHRLHEGLPFDLPPLELRNARMSEPYVPNFKGSNIDIKPTFSATVAMPKTDGGLTCTRLQQSAVTELINSGVPGCRDYALGWNLPVRDMTGRPRFSVNEWGLTATSTDRPKVETDRPKSGIPVAIETALKLGHYPQVVLTIRWYIYKVDSTRKGVVAELLALRLVEPPLEIKPPLDLPDRLANSDLLKNKEMVLLQCREAAHEIRELRERLHNAEAATWCCVTVAGGEVRVPMSVVYQVGKNPTITRDTEGLYLVYRTLPEKELA